MTPADSSERSLSPETPSVEGSCLAQDHTSLWGPGLFRCSWNIPEAPSGLQSTHYPWDSWAKASVANRIPLHLLPLPTLLLSWLTSIRCPPGEHAPVHLLHVHFQITVCFPGNSTYKNSLFQYLRKSNIGKHLAYTDVDCCRISFNLTRCTMNPQ